MPSAILISLDVSNGNYTLTATSIGTEAVKKEVTVNNVDVTISFLLQDNEQEVDEVTITGKTQTSTYMKSVENMGIYEGKNRGHCSR